MEYIKILILLCIIGICIYLLRIRKQKESMDNMMPESAAEACKKISSRAEEIEAAMDGAAKVVDSAWGFLSPKNYKSGDNKTDNMVRNIINTDLSNEDIVTIDNTCTNSSVSTQFNIIDTSNCPYCQINGCPIENIKQTNQFSAKSMCTLSTTIEALRSKTNSIDAQALAEVFQKAQGLMSGSNKSTSTNCNIINTNMSSKNYFDVTNKCVNLLSVDQKNQIDSCGPVRNVIQQNQFEQYNQCLQDNDVIVKEDIKADTKIKSEFKAKQESFGLDMWGSLISLIICCCSCCILSSILSIAGGGMGMTGEGPSPPPEMGPEIMEPEIMEPPPEYS
jgi:hypothetical protein